MTAPQIDDFLATGACVAVWREGCRSYGDIEPAHAARDRRGEH